MEIRDLFQVFVIETREIIFNGNQGLNVCSSWWEPNILEQLCKLIQDKQSIYMNGLFIFPFLFLTFQ